MRYDDASQNGSTGHEPVARPDVEQLPAGSFGPVSGNAITGAGTSSGAAGADSAAGASITAVQGAGGQAPLADGSFQATGQFGVLSMDAQGNFNYVRNAGTPEGVQDVFNYTLANANGTSTTSLTIGIGPAGPGVATAQNILNLPAGVEMSDIHVNGRDLVIDMPDGTQMVIPGGAVFVPQIAIGDVQVPPSNLAALLVDSEPQPAAGPPPSSGGNFADPVPPLDPGVPLGDLIPPTELGYTPPTFQEIFPGLHEPPTVVIITPDNPPPGVVNAAESVDEAGLPTRNGGEPAGSGEIADGNGSNNSDDSETNTGTIVFTTQGGFQSITVDGVAITQVGQTIQGQFGVMTITGINLGSGEITYSYTLSDNTSGDNTHDLFTIVVTDKTGDTATGTLDVNIIDDVPTARNDTDAVDVQSHVATGNVMTGVGTTSGAAGADTVGADNATLTSVSSNGTHNADSSFDGSGNLVVDGSFGTLTIKADGTYTYTLHSDAPGGSVDVFTYTLTDGDGDTSNATLTITNPDATPSVGPNATVHLDDDALAGGNPGGPGDDNPDLVNTTGTLSGSGGDGALTFALTANGAPSGFTYQLQANGDLWVLQGANHVLTVTVDPSNGHYTVTQEAPIDHSGIPGADENNALFDVSYTVTDSDGDSVTGHLPINVDDDSPTATNDSDSVDLQTQTADGNVITGVGTTSSGPDSAGADGNGHITGLSSNNVAGHVDNDVGGGGFIVVGEFGTLTMQADGSYTYQLSEGAPGGAVDVFTYTFTDGDGDSVTATLTIDNPDHTPTTGENPLVIVDDDDVSGANGIPGGTGDLNPQNATGTLSGSGGDGALTFALTDDGAPSGFTYQLQANGDLWVLQGATHVLTITVDSSNGDYTVTEVHAIDHPAGGDENNVNFDITYTVTDSDGDPASGTLSIEVNDDSPTVLPILTGEGGLTVDESGPTGAATIGLGGHPAGDDEDVSGSGPIGRTSHSINVDPQAQFGADGEASLAFGLDVTNSDSGLSTTEGEHITLVKINATTVLGIVDAGGSHAGEVAFAIQVNGASDVVTVEQYLSLDHLINPNPNDALQLGSNTIALTVTATDGDGDQAVGSVDISGQFTFLDDGPSANDDTDNLDGNGTATGNVITGASTIEGTANADHPGADGFGAITQLVGFNGSSDSDSTGGFSVNGHFGTLQMDADGNYTYTRTPGQGGGQDDTFTYVYKDGDGDTVQATLTIHIPDSVPHVPDISGIVVDDDDVSGFNGNPGGSGDLAPANTSGSVAATGGDGTITYALLTTGAPAGFTYTLQANGDLWVNQTGVGHVLTITLDQSGNYTVTEVHPITHTAGGAENNVDFVVSFSATDVDNDSDTGTLSIRVNDDTPLANNDSDNVVAGTAAGNVISGSGTVEGTANADHPGADGFSTITNLVGATTSDNNASGGFTAQGSFGTLQMDASGNYTYTRNDGLGGGHDDVFTYTYKDGDGDEVSATLTIHIPDSSPTVPDISGIVVDDDDVSGFNGNPGGSGDLAPANTSGSVAATGGDGTITYALLTTGAPAGFTYTLQANGDLWVNQTGVGHVLTITLDQSGNYTVTEVHPITHTAGGAENNVDFVVSFSATDIDNDSDTGTLSIRVNDDTPTASATLNSGATITVDESGPGAAATIGLGAHTAGNDEDVAGTGPISRAVSGSAVINANVSFGADGAAANQPVYAISVTNANSGVMTTEDEAISLVQLNSTTILGIVAAGGEHANQVAFAIQIGSDGKVTIEQYLSLDHPINPDPNDVLHLGANTISATVSATDGDGDTVTSSPVDISGQFSFNDDGPTLGAFQEANIDNAVGHVDGTYVFNWGADGFGGMTVTGPTLTGVTYTTTTAADGSVTLHANSGATELFNLVVHPDGTYTFNLVTPDAGSEHVQTLLNIASGQNEFIQTPDGLIEFTPLDHNGVDTGTVNSSGAGFGNGNQFTGNGEAVTFEFHSQNDAGDTPAGTHPQFVSEVKLDVPSNGFNGSTELITWYATNTVTHETTSGTILVDTNTNVLDINPGFDFNLLTIEGSGADGNGIRMTQITTITRILPQDIDLAFQIQATDDDGDPTGTSTLTVHVNADDTLQSTLVHTDSLMKTTSDTISLTSSNDNHPGHGHNDRAFAAGQSAALMAAVAAVGLEANHGNLGLHSGPSHIVHEPMMSPLVAAAVAAPTHEVSGRAEPTHLVHSAIVAAGSHEQQGGNHFHDLSPLAHGGVHGEGARAPTMTELLHGTATGAHAPAAHAGPVTAHAIVMPSAQQLVAAAAAHGGQQQTVAPEAQHDQVVSKVLADALHGGHGNGPNIDQLVESLHGHHGGGSSAIAALASHGGGNVSMGDMGFQMAFGSSHMVPMEEAMHVAAPAHHG